MWVCRGMETEACLTWQEAMRMKPVVASGPVRVALRDLVLGGGKYHIPAGTGMCVHAYSMQNSKHVWGPDAEEYRPVSLLRRLS